MIGMVGCAVSSDWELGPLQTKLSLPNSVQGKHVTTVAGSHQHQQCQHFSRTTGQHETEDKRQEDEDLAR